MRTTAQSWGMTNDPDRLEAAIAYREAAKADGWIAEPIYKLEDIDQACKLSRDGFVIHILTRTNATSKFKFNVSVTMWGPDRLSIIPPAQYCWETIQAGLRLCHRCKSENVDTRRVAFAGRVCQACYPAAKLEHEKPGWDS